MDTLPEMTKRALPVRKQYFRIDADLPLVDRHVYVIGRRGESCRALAERNEKRNDDDN